MDANLLVVSECIHGFGCNHHRAFLDRFEAAAAAGFKAVEFQVPYDYPGEDYKAAERTYISNLHAASNLAGHGLAGVIEPINKKRASCRTARAIRRRACMVIF